MELSKFSNSYLLSQQPGYVYELDIDGNLLTSQRETAYPDSYTTQYLISYNMTPVKTMMIIKFVIIEITRVLWAWGGDISTIKGILILSMRPFTH